MFFFFLLEIKINKKKIPYKGLDSKMSHKPNKGKGQFWRPNGPT